MADPTVTYAGWVFKEGSLVKNWKKRFLVVKRRELAYYKTTDHTSRHAQLLGAMRVMRVEKAAGITNGLIISSLEGRQLKIFMDTAAERDRCYAALAEWCHPGEAASAPPNVRVHGVATAAPRTVAATAAASRSRMAGWLEKQGQNMPTWKRRYFVLEDGILTYSQHEGGSSLARHRVLGVRRDRTRAFTLALTLDTGRELRVSATSEHDLEDWTRALRETIQISPSQRPSGQGGFEERSSGIDQRGQLDDSQASYNNLFGAPPAAVDDAQGDDAGRRSTNMSFGHNIRLDFDGENTSFIECAPPEPAAKPWSPKAPGVDTIRRMRIEQNLLVDSDDDDDEFVITRVVSSTQQSSSASGSSSPVPSRRPHTAATNKKSKDASVGPGPCCCVVM